MVQLSEAATLLDLNVWLCFSWPPVEGAAHPANGRKLYLKARMWKQVEMLNHGAGRGYKDWTHLYHLIYLLLCMPHWTWVHLIDLLSAEPLTVPDTR